MSITLDPLESRVRTGLCGRSCYGLRIQQQSLVDITEFTLLSVLTRDRMQVGSMTLREGGASLNGEVAGGFEGEGGGFEGGFKVEGRGGFEGGGWGFEGGGTCSTKPPLRPSTCAPPSPPATLEPRRVGLKPRKSGGPKGGGPKGGGPNGGGPKFRAFFFPLPPQNSFFSSLSGGLHVEFWWCLKRRGAHMCTFGVLRLPCEAPAARSGHMTTKEPKRAHLRVLVFKTPPKFNEKTPREGRKERILRRERAKKSEILGGPGEGRSRGRAVQGNCSKGGLRRERGFEGGRGFEEGGGGLRKGGLRKGTYETPPSTFDLRPPLPPGHVTAPPSPFNLEASFPPSKPPPPQRGGMDPTPTG